MPGRFGPSPDPAVHPTAYRVLLRRKSITVRLATDTPCPRPQLCPAPRNPHLPGWWPQSIPSKGDLAEMGLL